MTPPCGKKLTQLVFTVSKTMIIGYASKVIKTISAMRDFFPIIVCRVVYKKQFFCYTLGNLDYFLRITSLNRKNIVAIFSVWSRGDFHHKIYKKSKKKLILITSKANSPPPIQGTFGSGWVGWSRSHSDFVVRKSSQYSPIGAQ